MLPWYDRQLFLVRLIRRARDRAHTLGKKRAEYQLYHPDRDTDLDVCRAAFCRILGFGETKASSLVAWVKDNADHALPPRHGREVQLYQ